MITVNSYSSFSTEKLIWTGIYYCQGEKHKDKYEFYCGQGDCAFDRKKKIITCEHEDCSEAGKPITFNERKFHFNRLKNCYIPCEICEKPIIYTDFHKHVTNCTGEEAEEGKVVNNPNNNVVIVQNNIDNEIKDDSFILEIFNKDNINKYELLKCKICERFARDPFYICTHKDCLNKNVIFCCECYEENLSRNRKASGACVFDHTNNMGANENFVQRYDCLNEPIDLKVRNAVRRVIQEKLPTHLTFLMELNDYYKKYKDELEEEIMQPKVDKNDKLKEYKKMKRGFNTAFNNFTMSDAELKKATKRKDKVDKLINGIEQNKKKISNVSTEEIVKEENDDSDEEGRVRHSMSIKKQITMYKRESETEEEIKLKIERKQLNRFINCSIKWLREIPEYNLTKANIKILAEEISNNEKKLSFQEFSQYNYNYLSKLGKKTFDPPKYIARGCYDAKVNLANAGSCFTLANFPKEVKYANGDREVMTFKIAKIDFEDQNLKFDPCYLRKINTTEYGVIDLSEEENKILEDHNKLEKIPYEQIENARDFKVVKTPISNRTFIIGGKINKTIKEIYKELKNDIKVKTLKTELSYQFNEDFNIFNDISKIYFTQDQTSLRTEWGSSKIVRSTKKVQENLDMLIKKVSNTDVEYWVDKMYRDKAYINKIFESWKPLASDSSAARNTYSKDKIDKVKENIKTERAEELRRTKRKFESFGNDEEDKEETKESTQLDKSTRIEQETTRNLEIFIRDEWFIKFVKEYLTNLVEIRRDRVKFQLEELRKKFEYSELETFYPKYGHSVVANKDFVFITGGEYEEMDKSFEILVLKDGEREKLRKEERKILMDTERRRKREEEREEVKKIDKEKRKVKEENSKEDDEENEEFKFDDTLEEDDVFICRGPNLKNRRSKHASIIIQNYLYVIFGYVQDGDKPSMSFERIEIPPPNMTKINIDDFYRSREWEYYEIDYNYDWNVYFNCSNCIKTIDNKLVFYGTKHRITGSFKYVKIVAKLNVQKVSFTMSETDLSKWQNPFPSENDKNKSKEEQKNPEDSKNQKPKEIDEIEFCKENVHVPFVYCGEWYLPLISIQNSKPFKWNEESLKYEKIPG